MSSSTAARHPVATPHAIAIVESAEVAGWRFSCHKAPALSSVQRDELSAELRLRPAIPLPEVVFGNSTLRIDHPSSGLAIHFDAKEALHVWMQDHAEAAYVDCIGVLAT
jgi:type 2A phosphatase activator TIP41